MSTVRGTLTQRTRGHPAGDADGERAAAEAVARDEAHACGMWKGVTSRGGRLDGIRFLQTSALSESGVMLPPEIGQLRSYQLSTIAKNH